MTKNFPHDNRRQVHNQIIKLCQIVFTDNVYMYMYPWYQRCVCCTALTRPNHVETVQSAVAYSLVPHDDEYRVHVHVYTCMYVYVHVNKRRQ